MDLLRVFLYICNPFFSPFVPINTFVDRRGVFCGSGICVVLSQCAVSQVGFAVVEAVVVDVVADKVGGGIHNNAVHIDSLLFFVFGDYSCGVDGGAAEFAVPAKLSKAGVVFGVDFCEFVPGERDFAVGPGVVIIERRTD